MNPYLSREYIRWSWKNGLCLSSAQLGRTEDKRVVPLMKREQLMYVLLVFVMHAGVKTSVFGFYVTAQQVGRVMHLLQAIGCGVTYGIVASHGKLKLQNCVGLWLSILINFHQSS